MNVDPFQGIIDALNAPSITDWITAVGACLTFAVALIALVYAGRQVSEAKKSREQARDLEKERSQPYVVAYTDPSVASEAIIDLVIKNYGLTAAHNVRVSINPWPMRSAHGRAERVAVPDVIQILAPGQEWRTMWDSGLSRQKTDLPDEHAGQVTFEGIGGDQLSSPIALDWNIYKTRRWVEVYGEHDAAKALRDVRDTIKKWTEGVRGLKVYVRDGDARDERDRQDFEERMAEIEAEQAAQVEPVDDAAVDIEEEAASRPSLDGEPQETEVATDELSES